MGKSNLDQLFQERLGDLTISPSDAVRKVFNDRLSYRRKVSIIRKISFAASILIVLGAGFLGFNQFMGNPRIALEEIAQSGINDMNLFENIDSKSISIPLAKSDRDIKSFEETDVDDVLKNQQNQIIDSDKPAEPELSIMLVEAVEDENKYDQESEMAETENPIVAGSPVEGRLIEYSIIEPESKPEEQLATNEPIKITMEYKSSGNKSKESKIKQLYSKIDNMKSADEVFGDLRTLKDKVFAFNFKKENKVENQNNLE